MMFKENNRSAAGLRRSAIAERILLREEWSALKGTEIKRIDKSKKKQNIILHQDNTKSTNNAVKSKKRKVGKENLRALAATSEVLRGVVALVEVGAESRALALRAALTALGATVVPSWSPLVTHLIWAEGGCRSTRRRARGLACRLVSPLWVEACAASGEHLLEGTFPAAPRDSDLPSPKTLRRLLKRAEMENIPLAQLPTDSRDGDDVMPRLRISSETEHNTSVDTSRDTSNESHDKSADTSCKRTEKSTDVAKRVDPAPAQQRAAASLSAKFRRKLFTQKDADVSKFTNNETAAERTAAREPLTQRELRDLECAERMARRQVCARARTPAARIQTHDYNIFLTGMSRSERVGAFNAIRTLKGRVQTRVNKYTTHVVLGSCREDCANPANCTTGQQHPNTNDPIINIPATGELGENVTPLNEMVDDDNMAHRTVKLRTVNALLGAARGCRVLYAKWVTDSLAAKRWLHHYEYEVPHLEKITQRARAERQALGLMHKTYAYDVFYGMRVRVSPAAEQRDGVVTLLTLCGAAVQDGHHDIQNDAHHDIVIGVENGEVCSKWVFDSVASARKRTVRRYINSNVAATRAVLPNVTPTPHNRDPL